jgi:predicted HAD superfamily Cof-like phosphohydrolase
MDKKLSKYEMLERFHSTFETPVGEELHLISKKRAKLRYDLILEELNEYREAVENDDIVEVCDAIVDILYLTYGTAVEHGMKDKLDKMFNEVQNSNMSKLGLNGKPVFREDGKILKGPNYFRPNLKQFIK